MPILGTNKVYINFVEIY